jgi:hypothetical protein
MSNVYQRATMHVGDTVPDWAPDPGDDFILFYNTTDNHIYSWDGTAWIDRDITGGGGGSISGAWPVGSIFLETTGTNPATTLGFGTWAAWGQGLMPVGFKPGDTDFGTVEATGGEKAHALATLEVPSLITGQARSGTGQALGSGYNNDALPHNNLPPFIVVYMWKRTA